MRRVILALVVLAVIGAAAFWLLTTPRTLAAGDLPDHTPDIANGEVLFWAGGCKSCHAPAAAAVDDLTLPGGDPVASPIGAFHPPNISTHPTDGIGGWSVLEFVNAMKFGVGPGDRHLYPAFPYASYQQIPVTDLMDLKAFMDTLPAVESDRRAHDIPFPFTIRRGLGLWQLLHIDGEDFVADPAADDVVNRGAFLVNGPGHCGECHTPRTLTMATDEGRRFAGAPSPDGEGRVPNITSHADGIGDWTEEQIVSMFEFGSTPEFDFIGGLMGPVLKNLRQLDPDDRMAIARYLKTVAPHPGG